MYRAGVALEQIQHLLGHTSIKTTEIYIKARLPDLVAPAPRPMVLPKAGEA
jgi:site-specific recombinase XerD